MGKILKIKIPLIVVLAERPAQLEEILSLAPGAIIEFEKSSDGLLELRANGKIIGKGTAVKIGENFGLQLKEIGTLDETIKKLGKQPL
jgi:flagellar motor switch protein FliN/FliY